MYSVKIVGRSPKATSATSFLRPLSFGFVSAVIKGGSAVRMYEMLLREVWLVSTSTATCIGSSAGATRRTSRATLSSRTMKSAGPRSGTGAPASFTTLTYNERWSVCAAACAGGAASAEAHAIAKTPERRTFIT